MPSSLLLLIPLLGGYLFSHILHFSRFRAQGLDGHRLIFEAGVAGMFWLLPARLMIVWLRPHIAPEAMAYWGRLSGDEPFLATAILAAVAACVVPIVANYAAGAFLLISGLQETPPLLNINSPVARAFKRYWRASQEYFLNRAVKHRGNALQKILHRAAREAKNLGTMVGLTLDDRRVNAGYVASSPNLSPKDDFISLYPVMSGARREKTLRVGYSYNYPKERLAESIGHIHRGSRILPSR